MIVGEFEDVPISGISVEVPSADFKRWSVSTEDLLLLISKALDGKMVLGQAPDGTLITEKIGKPLIRGRAKQLVMQTIAAFIQKHSLMSNLTDKEIYSMAETVHLQIANLLFIYYNPQEIGEPENIPLICSTISSIVFMALKRAKGGETWKGLTSVTQVVEQRAVREEVKEKGGLFKLWGEEK